MFFFHFRFLSKWSFFSTVKKREKTNQMLCECQWGADEQYYLCIIKKSLPFVPDAEQLSIEEDDALPLCKQIWGKQAIMKGLISDCYWLEQQLINREPFSAILWYPASFLCPEDMHEKVTLQYQWRGHFDVDIHSETKDHDRIPMRPVNFNKFASCGWEVVPWKHNQPMSTLSNFHAKLLELVHIQKPHREVQKRQIYYLSELFKKHGKIALKEIENDFELHELHPLLKSCMHLTASEELELWNAFVVVIPAGKKVPPQIVHRDSFYQSVSVCFYLDEPCDPQTSMYPFTDRLLNGIRQGFIQPSTPRLLPLENVLIMNGRLLHFGAGSTQIHDKTRVLYIFQYRPKMTRAQRSKQVQMASKSVTTGSEATMTTFVNH